MTLTVDSVVSILAGACAGSAWVLVYRWKRRALEAERRVELLQETIMNLTTGQLEAARSLLAGELMQPDLGNCARCGSPAWSAAHISRDHPVWHRFVDPLPERPQ